MISSGYTLAFVLGVRATSSLVQSLPEGSTSDWTVSPVAEVICSHALAVLSVFTHAEKEIVTPLSIYPPIYRTPVAAPAVALVILRDLLP